MRKKTLLVALTTILIGSTTTPAVNIKATESPSIPLHERSTILTTPAQFVRMDNYVQVRNNQYVLSDEATRSEDTNTVKSIQQSLNLANQAVRSSSMLIDPVSKVASSYTALNSLPGKTTYLEWYGVRNIYRSNAAIYKDISQLRNASQSEGSLSTPAGVAGVLTYLFPAVSFGLGFLSAVSGVRSWVFKNWYQTLSEAQRAYPTKKIRWDVYWTTNSQAGVWNGN